MDAESEPDSGSVIAIAAQRPSYRWSCSSFATAEIAAFPRPWRGIERTRPTSPQQVSITPSAEDMLVPLRLPVSVDFDALTPDAPAPADAPESFMPSISAASMSSSFGYSCSATSYLREIGRSTSCATWWACSERTLNFLGISRLMAIRPRDLLPPRPLLASRDTSARQGVP